MASLYTNLIILSILFFIKPHFIATQTSFRPKALVLPITKDPSTNQYLTTINQRTPLVPVKLTVDLGGPNLWTDCEGDFVSSTYKHAICGSAQCKSPSRLTVCTQCFIPPNTPGCHVDSCGFLADNPITGTIFVNAEIGQDVVSVRSTNGSNPGRPVSAPRFIFTCAITSMLEGLASGVKGVAGLGRNRISLPQQLASIFSFKKKFAICLSSSKNGVVFFGDGPYFLQPNNIDVAKNLIFTPLILNPLNPGKSHFEPDPSPEYFIGVSSIKINGNSVPLNKTLLKINKIGYGGTKISTAHPYTIMHRSIYNAFINTFIKELARVPRVQAVAPFGVCYNSTFISVSRTGPGVPAIDFVLQSNDVFWRIFGSNSMVEVKKDVICLAFVDGGNSDRINSIVIGGHQLEDNLLQFDLASSRLGFSSSLLIRQTTCGNFDFTSTV